MENPDKFKTYWVIKDGKRQPVIIDSKKIVNGYSLYLMSRSYVFTIGLPVFGERIVAVKSPNGHTEVFETFNSFSDAIERYFELWHMYEKIA